MINEKTKIIDVDNKIVEFMEKMLSMIKYEQKTVDWDKFEIYCKSFGETPHIFCVPKPVIDRCTLQIDKRRYE